MSNDKTEFDVIIVGGGVVGCALARELSKFESSVLLVEKEEDVGYGTSKANSGIVHAGHHSDPTLKKGQFVVEGNRMIAELSEILHFGFRKCGELVIARSEDDVDKLKKMKELGDAKGVPGLEFWDRERLEVEEPNLADSILCGLYAPSAAVVNSYELTMALAENAARNGAVIKVETPVEGIKKAEGGYLVTTPTETFKSKFVVNTAGLFADKVEQMLGIHTFDIKPRKGEEFLLDKCVGHLARRIIFPVPSAVSKGILVIPTVDGTTMVGPTAEETDSRTNLSTSVSGCNKVFSNVQTYIPGINSRDVIASFSGLRAASDTGDFILGCPDEEKFPGFINCAGIQSPGLTSAPALALHLVDLLKKGGLECKERDGFIPSLPKFQKFFDMEVQEQCTVAKENPLYSRVVCRCELVTEGDVNAAIDRGARSLDSIKFRTRAGMGRCQGGFCTSRILEILSTRLNVPIDAVSKRGSGTQLVFHDPSQIDSTKSSLSTDIDAYSKLEQIKLKNVEEVSRPPAFMQSSKIEPDVIYDVAVVGGGPAGLAAATGALKNGAKRVLVLDREPYAGGILLQCIHSGFGLKYFKEELTGPEYAEKFLSIALSAGVEIVPNAFVTDVDKIETGGHKLRVLSGRDGQVATVRSKSCVLAMGCRERTRAAIRIPGTRPAGVYTAGLAQKIVNEMGYFPGKKVVILGSGDIGLIMARRLTLEGCNVQGVFEIMPYCNGLKRNLVQCLHDYHIPLHTSFTVVEIHGDDRLEAVTVAPVDSSFKADMSKAYRIACDTLLLSVGLIPENELSGKLGIRLDGVTKGPLVNSTLMTNVEGVFACGNVLHVHDIVDNVSEEGLKAGAQAAQFALQTFEKVEKAVSVTSGENVGYVLPQVIDGAKEQKLSLRVKQMFVPAVLKIRVGEKTVIEKKYPIVLPAEMIIVNIPKSKLAQIDAGATITVACVEGVKKQAGKTKKGAEGETEEDAENTVYTCVNCPKGCDLQVCHRGKDVIDVSGNECNKGIKYAKQEHVDPRRVFSTTVRVRCSPTAMKVPVKLTNPVPKDKILASCHAIHSMIVTAPITVGQVLASNLIGCEGVDVVACREVRACDEGEKALFGGD